MAVQKIVKVGGATGLTEVSTIDTSDGAGSAGAIASLDSAGKFHISFMPTGVGGDTQTLTAGESLSAGDLIYINGSGQVLKADADSSAKSAIGFVLSSIANGATGTVYLGSGLITGLTSLTPGALYYLSATAGGVTTTAPSTAGQIQQVVGNAVSSTVLYFEPQRSILIA